MFALNIRNAPAAMGIGPPSRAKNSADYRNNTLLAGAFANPENPLSLVPPNRTHLTVQPLLPPIISRARTTLSQPISRGNGKSEPCVKLALNLRMRGEPRALTKSGRSSLRSAILHFQRKERSFYFCLFSAQQRSF